MKRFMVFVACVALLSSARSQWIDLGGMSGIGVTCMYADADTLYAGTSTLVYRSTDFGFIWGAGGTGLPTVTNFLSIVRSGNFLVAGGNNPGIWRYSIASGTWTQSTSGVSTNERAEALLAEGNSVYGAFSSPPSIGISTDNGATWTKTTSGLPTSGIMTGIAKIGTSLFACHQTLGVYISTDNGTTWSQALAPIPPQNKSGLVASNTALIVVTSGPNPTQNAIYRSTNGGSTWLNMRSGGSRVWKLVKIGTTVYVVGDTLFRSIDNGATWTPLNIDGLVGGTTDFQIAGLYAFASSPLGVQRRTVATLVSVRDHTGSSVPEEFRLEQNYPNPFNPSTSISFSTCRSGFVSLKVFDALGQDVRTLVNENLHAGSYTVKLDAENLSSGIYLYRLQADGYAATRKATLLR